MNNAESIQEYNDGYNDGIGDGISEEAKRQNNTPDPAEQKNKAENSKLKEIKHSDEKAKRLIFRDYPGFGNRCNERRGYSD